MTADHPESGAEDLVCLSADRQFPAGPFEQQLLTGCRFLREVCVVAVPGGGFLHAIAVPDLERVKAEKLVFVADRIRYDIENSCRSLPDWQQVHSVEVQKAPLPRDPSGRLQRSEVLAQLFKNRSTEFPFAAPDEPAAFALLRNLKKSKCPIVRDTSLELDLCIDSLERTALFTAAEARFGIVFSEDEMAGILTAGEFADAVGSRHSNAAAGTPSWSEILRRPLTIGQAEIARECLRRDAILEWLCYLLTRVLRLPARLLFSFQVAGTENLPRDFPFLICANHASYLDVFFLAMALPSRVVRRLFFFGAAKHSKSKKSQWVWRKLRGIRIDEGADLITPLRLGAEGLNRGLVLCLFPEGRRSIDGELRPFRGGTAILAIEADVPVVPVAIIGSGFVLGRASTKLRIGPVRMVFGPPVAPAAGNTCDAFTGLLYGSVRNAMRS